MQSYIKKYLDSPDVEGLAQKTRTNYGTALKQFGDFCSETCTMKGCSMKPNMIVSTDMQMFVDYLKRKGIGATSIQAYVRAVKIFMRWSGSPIEFTYRMPREDRMQYKKKQRERWFSEKDIQVCLGYEFPCDTPVLRTRNRAMVRIFIETGARLREVTSITKDDIFLDEMMVNLRDSKTEPRPAFFSPETKELMEKFIPFLDQTSSTPVFENAGAIITNMLVDLGLKNGTDGRGPHTFRHYTATYLYYVGGMDLVDIATYLGDKPETIRETYLHPTPAMMRKRVAKAMGWV